MRLILRKEVEKLGDVGDVVEVADGYGLNYLLPKGLAIQATAGSLRSASHEQHLRGAQIEAARRGADAFSRRFSGVELEFVVRAGEDGRLFGSVTNRDLEAALAERGLEVNRRRILLEEPIRKLGEYEVAIHLHPEVKPLVRVHVVAEDEAAGPEAGPEAEGGGDSETEGEAAVGGEETGEAAPG